MCTGSSAALIKSLPTYYGWLGGNRIRSADISGWFLEANLGQWAISEERDRVRGQSREREREACRTGRKEGTRSRLFHRKSSRSVAFTEER